MYYELATLTLRFGTAAQAAANAHVFCTLRGVKSSSSDHGLKGTTPARGEFLGCWFSDIGTLNQLIILRGFQTLDDLLTERQRTQQALSPFGCGDFFETLEQHSYRGFDWMPPVRPSSEGGVVGPVYEIRTYGIKPGGVKPTLDLWQDAMPARSKLSPCLVAMVALDGPLRFTNIWAYPSLNARSHIRAEAVAQGVWPPKGGPAFLTTAMTSTIALPTAASPLQ